MKNGLTPVLLGNFWETAKWPFPHFRHKVISLPVSFCIISTTDFSASRFGISATPMRLLHIFRLSFFHRFASNPMCRIRMNFFGNTWRRIRQVLAFGTMAVATRAIGYPLFVAVVAHFYVSAKIRCAPISQVSPGRSVSAAERGGHDIRERNRSERMILGRKTTPIWGCTLPLRGLP